MKNRNKGKAPKPAQTVWVDPKKHTITFTLKKWEQEKYKLQDITVKETAKMYLVALAEMGWTQEQLIELFIKAMRYDEYVKDGCVSIETVEEIIEKYTGMTCGN